MILADPKSREEWLKARHFGIGGSDAACIVGANKYKTNVQLWEEKPVVAVLEKAVTAETATMIRKVAKVQALREAFPEDFEGMYTAEATDEPVSLGDLGDFEEILSDGEVPF